MPLKKSEFLSHVWQDGLFKGKVVFCTGGNGTICSAQVRALVYLGANACIVGRNEQKTLDMAKDLAAQRQGAKVIGIGNIDVRDIDLLSKAAERCAKELGGIDFLIAGAAGNFLAPMAQLSANAFKTVMDIDVLGSYNVTKVCIPYLLESVKKYNSQGGLPKSDTAGPSGRIIYVSATMHYTGMALQTHVVAAKAAVDAISHNVALEYGPLGITSNIIAPGPIAGTEGMDRLGGKLRANERPGQRLPLGRWGSIKEIADATVWLFSDAANYVTGQTTIVDGGAWHVQTGPGSSFPYPDFLLSGQQVTGVGGSKRKETSSKL
ncbi:Peroxisomal 2,4-dienoyl-CoA SPS19 [Cyphellophora attinorum]|uniref:2,4-dienoyl-CoA reductase [(3E)-enoyl-CoA-producing] n=1 Tax=Cyphellophora attinorum TaxID=1664694 RepID=A0A0N1H748_9EURO|nr:Peroxisomal 2,4-dienoyl-CoA SPS19 [Phialophora attinorum]KPI42150.1 Peroxisomal 2,4-dienoyl-CoA SPS19 [Phialophora attinorum]